MKIFILTCVNENSELCSCKSYRTREEAQVAMLNQFNNERGNWTFGNLEYEEIDNNGAGIGNEGYCYEWKITEDEL